MAEANAVMIDEAIGIHVGGVAQAQVERAAHCLGWRGGRLHDGVHEARKALRRARAMLALALPRLGTAARAVDRQLAVVGRRLSSLRDAMARVETLDRLLRREGEDSALLRRCRGAAARVRANAARTALAADPGLISLRTRLESAGEALRALPWTRLQGDDLQRALDHAGERARKARDRACKHGGDAAWHRWRRRLRLLVHVRAVLGKAGVAMPSAMADELRLAAALGRAQDLAVLKSECTADALFARADRKLVRRLVAQRLRRARRTITRRIPAIDLAMQAPAG